MPRRGMNALAESVPSADGTLIGLFKAEVIRPRGPWHGFEDVRLSPSREFAVLEWVWWYNHQRLLEPLGYRPPAESPAESQPEEAFYSLREAQALEAVLNEPALRQSRGGSI